jgi:hypothetical protein
MQIETVINQITERLYSESKKCYYAIPYVPANHRSTQCTQLDCGAIAYAKGLCNAHYIRMRKRMRMDLPVKNRKRGTVCLKCNKILNGKGGWGLCQTHYSLMRSNTIKLELIKIMGGKCSKCLNSFAPSVYDFHHTAKKDDSISNLIRNGSVKDICKEAIKCILLCANCHREIHNEAKDDI